ncbi:hypothetical protein A3Q56_05929 [Intoshia linei]|uniref:Mitochondrial transcription rescue factor 1 C-terminal domain-containing protein n=1 Tax=Intoshia linei TaxID=1819745 RepID=A0A177AWJ1_9BILA|nr:hypothetical protein A3Q56_05929 [Intoshia linei]
MFLRLSKYSIFYTKIFKFPSRAFDSCRNYGQSSDENDDVYSIDGTANVVLPNPPYAGRTYDINIVSGRIDAIVAAGLNISRAKAIDKCLTGCVYVNAALLLKKSWQGKEGDVIDVRDESPMNKEETEQFPVRRVKVDKISSTESKRKNTTLTTWRRIFNVNSTQYTNGK